MKIYKGVLDWWFETGTEGTVWILQEDGKEGYDGMVVIKPGDCLTVFGEDGSIIFNEEIVPDYETGKQPYPFNPSICQQAALGYWIHWIQKGWQPDDWAKLFFRAKNESPLRAELTRNK